MHCSHRSWLKSAVRVIADPGYVPAPQIALIYLGLHQADGALDPLERGLDERSSLDGLSQGPTRFMTSSALMVAFRAFWPQWDSPRERPPASTPDGAPPPDPSPPRASPECNSPARAIPTRSAGAPATVATSRVSTPYSRSAIAPTSTWLLFGRAADHRIGRHVFPTPRHSS